MADENYLALPQLPCNVDPGIKDAFDKIRAAWNSGAFNINAEAVTFSGTDLTGDGTNITYGGNTLRFVPEYVVEVAKAHGGYSTITTALASITDASATKPYTILVYPGVYAEDITAKDYVSIVGVGELGDVIVQAQSNNGINLSATCVIANIQFESTSTSVTGATTRIYASNVNTLRQTDVNTVYADELLAGQYTTGVGGSFRGLTVFNLSSLSGATVTLAKLWAYLDFIGHPATNPLDIHSRATRLLRTITPTEVTWNSYSSGNSWTTAGANSINNDYVTTEQADGDTEYSCPSGMTTDVHAWDSITCTALVQDLIDEADSHSVIRWTTNITTAAYFQYTPASGVYLDITYDTGEATAVYIASGSPILYRCRIKGSETYTIGVSTLSTGTVTILDCDFNTLKKCIYSEGVAGTVNLYRNVFSSANNHVYCNQYTGTLNSAYNRYIGAGTHLIQALGTLYSSHDEFASSSGTISFKRTGTLLPATDDTFDLGSSTYQWNDLYVDGKAYIDGIGENCLVDLDVELEFGDSAVHVSSQDDGHLDLTADTAIDLNGVTIATNAIYLTQTDGAEKIDSDADGDMDLYAGTSIDMLIGGTEQITLTDGKLAPTTDNDIDLGDGTHEFKDVYVNGQIKSTLATGTSPFSVASTTVVTNLNADTVDGVGTAGLLLLDQTSPQTIANGVPLMTTSVDTDGSSTQLVNKAYVDLAVASLTITEFFRNEADALAGLYYVMDVNADTAGTVVSATLTSSPENIFNFITPVDHPHLDRLPAGVYDCHAHLLRTNATGNRVITCYYELYNRTSGGVETKLATSASTGNLGATDAFYDVYLTLDTEVALSTTDRIVIKWYATTVSGTGNTTVTMTTGGTVDPHFSLKTNSLELDQIFVPYSGATHDTDLGAYDITTTGTLTATTHYADHIAEMTGAHGIVLDHDLSRTGKISVDHITEATGAHGVIFDVFPSTPSAAPDADYEVANKKYVDDNIGAGGGATTALDNLASVAINTALLPGADNTIDLGAVGGTDYRFRHLYLSGNISDETNTLTVANAKTAYDHSQDNTQAHSDYLLNSGNDETSGTLTMAGINVTGESVVINSDAAEADADWKYTLTRPVAGMTASVTLTLPTTDGGAGEYLKTNGSGALSWDTPGGVGGGDVTAAANLTDNAIVRGDGGAKGVQTTGITIADTNNMLIPIDVEIEFGDAAVHVSSQDDGRLDLTADVAIDLNGLVQTDNAIYLTQTDGAEKIDSDGDGDVDIYAGTSIDLLIGGTEQVTLTDGVLSPTTDDDVDLGDATHQFKDLYVDGTANIDALVADTADINAGTVDGATIATCDITVGAGKTLDVSAGTLTLANNQISGDKVEGGTIAATTITTLTSTTVNVDHVAEATGAHGIVLDNDLSRAGKISTDHLAEATGAHGIVLDNDMSRAGKISVDHLTEATGSHGVIFDVFPTTPSANPDADYEVANKKYVDAAWLVTQVFT